MSTPIVQLVIRREALGRDWEAAFARDDLAGMDAAMDQIRAISHEFRLLAEAASPRNTRGGRRA